MADSAVRAEALRLISDAQAFGSGALRQGPAVAMAILDLADAVRELAKAKR